MYTSKIADYRFELKPDTERVLVYKEGAGVDPIAYIHVEKNIPEKDFHYEIMDFITKLDY
jgi:hypothetical protein